jgi:hypothetical protein
MVKKVTKIAYAIFESEHLHHFPGAPALEKPEGVEHDVSFLQHPHRHIFKFRVDVEVSDLNREVEFILMKRALQHVVDDEWAYDLGAKSCEMMAFDLYEVVKEFGWVPKRIEVSEDGENGAVVTWD